MARKGGKAPTAGSNLKKAPSGLLSPAGAPGPGDPAAIVHTLGNTGEPRGAVLTHGGLVRNAASIASGLACTPDDVFLGAVPFSNAFGLTPTIPARLTWWPACASR